MSGLYGGGGTVGAEELTVLSEAIDRMDKRVLQVNAETTTMVARAEEQIQNATAGLEERVTNVEFEFRRIVNDVRNQASDLRSSVFNVEHKQESQINELQNGLNKVTALTMSNLGQA